MSMASKEKKDIELNSGIESIGNVTDKDFKDKDFLFDVIKRCQDGDKKAMEMVYINYRTPLFNLAYRFSGNYSSAEDLLQDIFIKIFTKINRLRSLEAFNSWLYCIAINTCMSFARKKGKAKEVSLDEMDNTPHSQYDKNSVKGELEYAIQILSPKQKSIFLLHDVQGYTHIEIAEMMKSTEGTSKSQLFKARMKIRNHLRSIAS